MTTAPDDFAGRPAPTGITPSTALVHLPRRALGRITPTAMAPAFAAQPTDSDLFAALAQALTFAEKARSVSLIRDRSAATGAGVDAGVPPEAAPLEGGHGPFVAVRPGSRGHICHGIDTPPHGAAAPAIIGAVIRVGGRRQRRRWQLIGAACVLLVLASSVYAVWQISHGGLQAADTAGVLGLPLGASGLVAATLALRKPLAGNDAELATGRARTLAGQVAGGESVVRRQLLGNDVQRINLHYLLQTATARAAQAPPAGQAFTDGTVSLPDITAYYRATRPARLIITGAPGAGKTVLALELLLALIADRGDHDPVPVRVPLAQWDTNIPLQTLLIQRLTDAYDWPAELAANIVDHGLVLPVLDGLDEMDPTRPDGTPDPDAPRARAALDQLNNYQDRNGLNPAPLILTCRTTHYDALPHTDTLIDAARVTIAPVGSGTAATYLAARARDPRRWQPFLHHLTHHPTSPQALLLSTPWRLCLAATVYHRTGDPAELLHHPTQTDLDHHLLARYIPATTHTTNNPHHYTPDEIHHWLHHLTTHLTPTPSNPTPHTDLTLHKLWPLAGHTRIRTTDALLTTLAALLPLPLAWTTTNPTAAAATIALFAALAGLSTLRSGSLSPSRLDTQRLRTTQGLRRLAIGLAVGLAYGLAIGLAGGLAGGLTFGLACGLVCGLLFALTAEPTEAATPRLTIREDAISVHMAGLVAAVMLVVGFARTFLLTIGLAYGLACGLAFGLALGLAFGTARRYAVFLLCSRGRLPFRLARFLDWACTAGLMRYSGPAYQFRHRELQQWLTTHPTPTT